MHNIAQKIHVNGKILVERAIFCLIHIGTCSIQCEILGTVYHPLILGGVIFRVIFIENRNKELSHIICQEDPQ